jgi:hypothetical protein
MNMAPSTGGAPLTNHDASTIYALRHALQHFLCACCKIFFVLPEKSGVPVGAGSRVAHAFWGRFFGVFLGAFLGCFGGVFWRPPSRRDFPRSVPECRDLRAPQCAALLLPQLNAFFARVFFVFFQKNELCLNCDH